MSYNSLTGFGRPLLVELGRSRLLAATAAAVHVLAVAACLLAGLHLSVRLLLAGLTVVHYGCFLRRQVSARTRGAVSAVAWDKPRGWRVRSCDGGWQPAQLLLPVFVSVPLVVMRFRVSPGRTCSAMVVSDRLPADDFRRLRVRLLQTVRGNGN